MWCPFQTFDMQKVHIWVWSYVVKVTRNQLSQQIGTGNSTFRWLHKASIA